ncbi:MULTISPECIES: hypothetical protein [unclassified Janthinobacterium]|uniref:hypothetical protein n=1 Tax=unclassified Janthinobacterium TaxID=2610881 RepID=UPI0012FA6C80|nr:MULTISPECIES: hypothetical protein [unclassified Janthinobacterium]MEC5163174.1 hypothetical protein [Janthinobacterium sp. CG_S6]
MLIRPTESLLGGIRICRRRQPVGGDPIEHGRAPRCSLLAALNGLLVQAAVVEQHSEVLP